MTWHTIGFKPQKKYFEQLMTAGLVPHALLFTGPDMIGKRMLAFDIYALINGREFKEGDPDIRVISPRVAEDETKIYIEDIRDLKSFLSLKAYYGPSKFVIINDADRLTPEASNALLKVLEEPTPKTVLILVSSRPRALLPTITSRCQQISFLPHSVDEMKEFLADKKISKADQALLASMAQGRIGWLIWAADHVKEIRESVADLTMVLKGGVFERMAYAKKIYEKETYPATVANWIYWIYGNQSEVPHAGHLLKELTWLNNLVAQPQYNHRLALENTLLNL